MLFWCKAEQRFFNKNILWSCVPVMEDCIKRVRVSNNAIIDEGDLWLVSNYTNILMNYDIYEGNLKRIFYFPEKFTNPYSTISYEKVKDEIYFAPYNGKNLWRFHISEKKFELIDLKLGDIEKNIKQKFRGIIYYEHELILIGFGIHSIFRIDIISNTVRRCDGYLVELKKRGIEAEETFLGYSYQLVGDILYLPMLNHNIIIAFYLTDDYFRIYDMPNLDSDGLDTIEYYNGKFRLLTSSNDELIWNREYGQQSKIKLGLMEAHKRNYWKTFQNNGVFIYFPLFDPEIYVKDKGGNIETLSFLYPELESFRDASKYEFIKENNGKIYFQVRSNGDCYYIDLEQMSICPIRLEVPDKNTYEKVIRKIYDSVDKNKLHESEVVNLKSFLYFMEFMEDRYLKEIGKDKQYGEIIYKSFG